MLKTLESHSAGGACLTHCSWTAVLLAGRQPGSALHSHPIPSPRAQSPRQRPRELRHHRAERHRLYAPQGTHLAACSWFGVETGRSKATSGLGRRTVGHTTEEGGERVFRVWKCRQCSGASSHEKTYSPFSFQESTGTCIQRTRAGCSLASQEDTGRFTVMIFTLFV